MVAVTNHLPEETVELFELVSTESSWQLVWRGCVKSPLIESGARLPMFNDVALTSDGAFYVTEMYNRMMPFDELIAAGVAGESSGGVVLVCKGRLSGCHRLPRKFPQWRCDKPCRVDTLFVNYWFSGETTKLDLTSGEVLATHQGGRADNLTFAAGSVWAAKHDMTIMEYVEGCPADSTNCFLPFSVHELNPDDLSEKTRGISTALFSVLVLWPCPLARASGSGPRTVTGSLATTYNAKIGQHQRADWIAPRRSLQAS